MLLVQTYQVMLSKVLKVRLFICLIHPKKCSEIKKKINENFKSKILFGKEFDFWFYC